MYKLFEYSIGGGFNDEISTHRTKAAAEKKLLQMARLRYRGYVEDCKRWGMPIAATLEDKMKDFKIKERKLKIKKIHVYE